MRYLSTRGNCEPVQSAEAIRLGMVPAGGLFIPETIPRLDYAALAGLEYPALAAEILAAFLPDFDRTGLDAACAQAYAPERFPVPGTAPLVALGQGTHVLELFHGPTAAFKDFALQILPRLLTAAVAASGSRRETVILVATSGDTGKAALEGFRDVPGTRVIVFYPRGGVSRVQELQMLTTAGANTHAVAVEGNFDDCQSMVKDLFGDAAYGARLAAAGYELSSANSINWGRLVPQLVYYAWAYGTLVRQGALKHGDEMSVVVPTGNFGNILAAWYARESGLPVKRLVCASNRNQVLTDFFRDGRYDRRRDFHRTTSPSMDILVSSNLERFLCHLAGPAAVAGWYADLAGKGEFTVDAATKGKLDALLWADCAGEEETAAAIRGAWEQHGYLMDTHTAVGAHVLGRYRAATGDDTPVVLDSTASPFKFNTAVWQALTGEKPGGDEFALLAALEKKTGVPVHRSLAGLDTLPRKEYPALRLADGAARVLEMLGIK